MPVDPSISLAASATGNAGGNPLTVGNLIDTISKFATLQNSLNQNRLFQQTFEARTRAGQIIAGAPSLDAGLQLLFKDPQTAAFAGEIANTARQMENTMADIATKRQGLAQSGVGFTIKNLATALADPTSLESAMGTGLATVDPLAAPAVRSAMSSVVRGLGHGLPADPAAAQQMYRARMTGMLLSSGFTPEALHELTGTPRTAAGIDPATGLRTEVGAVQAPAWAGGALSPAGAGVVGGATPGELITPHPGPVGPGGQPTSVTGGDILRGAVPGLTGSMPTSPDGNALGLPAPARGPVGAGTKPPLSEESYLTNRGKDMAEYQKSLDERVAVGTTIMQTVAEGKDALAQVRAGGGGTAYAQLAQLAQAFGAGNELVDKIANGNLAASQEFSKLMVNTTMGQIREQLQGIGGSRLSQMEFQSFQKNNPNLDTDPRAIDKIFNFWTRLYNRDTMEQGELNNHLESGKGLSSWPATWQKIMRERGIVGTSSSAAGSQREAPIAGGATHQFIPGRGIVPIEQPAR